MGKFTIRKQPVNMPIGHFLLGRPITEGGTLIDDHMLVAEVNCQGTMDLNLGRTINSRDKATVFHKMLDDKLAADKPAMYQTWKRNKNREFVMTSGTYYSFQANLIKRVHEAPMTVEACLDNMTTTNAVSMYYALKEQFKALTNTAPAIQEQLAYNIIRYVDMTTDKLAAAQHLLSGLSEDVSALVRKAFGGRGKFGAASFVKKISNES